MIKRIIWMGFGAVIGASGSYWANRRVRQVVDRYAPAEVRERITSRVRNATGHIRTAVSDGRDAMREREAELRGRPDRQAHHPGPRRNPTGRHTAGR